MPTLVVVIMDLKPLQHVCGLNWFVDSWLWLLNGAQIEKITNEERNKTNTLRPNNVLCIFQYSVRRITSNQTNTLTMKLKLLPHSIIWHCIHLQGTSDTFCTFQLWAAHETLSYTVHISNNKKRRTFIVTLFIDLIFDSFVTDANIWIESDH